MKNQDEKIKKWIKSIEKEIPFIVEKKFLQKLHKISLSGFISQKRFKNFFKISIAAAACLMLAVQIFFPLLQRKPNQLKEVILVESAKIEGKTAYTYIFKEKDPELTIIWVER